MTVIIVHHLFEYLSVITVIFNILLCNIAMYHFMYYRIS